MSTRQSDHPLGAHPGPGRAETRERLSKAGYDLLVIGGGILGTSVDWHSAHSGLRVAMVDMRRLRRCHVLRLLQARPRRSALPANRRGQTGRGEPPRAAGAGQGRGPHLANPPTFYLPVYKGDPHSAAKLGAGVFAYSMLSAFGDGAGRLISPARAAADTPGLRTYGLKAVAVCGDHQMNDARVAVMTVRAAVRSGAVVSSPTTCLVAPSSPDTDSASAPGGPRGSACRGCPGRRCR